MATSLGSRTCRLKPNPPASSHRQRFRPTWAEVSLGAYASNIRALSSLAAPAKIMAVLKADAYGHGAAALAPVALENGASIIGVSSIEEGLDLRENGIDAPILLLGSVYPLENFAAVLEGNLIPTVSSLDSAQTLSAAARIVGARADFHLKVDTGMGRIGVSPSLARAVIDFAAKDPHVRLAGVFSHFASSDSDAAFSEAQLREFLAVRDAVRAAGVTGVTFHIANSSALITRPASRLDLARPGIAAYGLPTVPSPAGTRLRPVLSLKSTVVFQKRVPAGTSISYGRTWKAAVESEIATLPVGYADGLPRVASGKAQALVRGRRCPIVGRITMDQVMVDVTGTNAAVGDEAVLIGEQGKERLTADDWAGWAGTISYEILTGLTKRVPRVIVP